MRSMAILASVAFLGCGRIGIDALTGDAGGSDTGGGGNDGGIDMPGAITVGKGFACVVRSRVVWCWGDDHSGQLGDNATAPQPHPARVFGLSDAIAVVAGESHACALRAAGAVSC